MMMVYNPLKVDHDRNGKSMRTLGTRMEILVPKKEKGISMESLGLLPNCGVETSTVGSREKLSMSPCSA